MAYLVSGVVALSCKKLFLVLQKNNVLFRPSISILPKVVSNFHLHKDIVLPSLLYGSGSLKGNFHLLSRNVGCASLPLSHCWRLKPELPIPPSQTIIHAYGLRNWVPPFPAMEHSTRSVSASWHQASVSQICEAATWSSVHMFSTFYQLDISGSFDASFT